MAMSKGGRGKISPEKMAEMKEEMELGVDREDVETNHGAMIAPADIGEEEEGLVVVDRVGEIPLTAMVERCRRRVVYDGLGIREAAEEFGVNAATVRKWAKVGNWSLERRVVLGGQEEAVAEAMVKFSMAGELPLASAYFELQKKAIGRLSEVLDKDGIGADTISAVLEVAGRGMDLGERVLNRGNPKRALNSRETVAQGGGMDIPGGGRVQVNVLNALQDAKRRGE